MDVCVIGSGMGGAVVASELARRGAKVTVLERGRAYGEHVLTRPTWEIEPIPYERAEHISGPRQELPPKPHLRSHQLGKSTVGPRRAAEVLAVVGVGGGTLRYQAVSRRLAVPWAPPYEAAEKLLGVTRHPMSEASEFVKRSGLKLEAAPVAILDRDQGDRKACIRCAGCAYGCPIGAKTTGDILLRGVKVVTNAEVTRIEKNSVLHKGGRIEADVIVLSAGALGTPRILLKSGIDAGRGIMESLRVTLTLLCEERLRSYRGVPIDAICDLGDFIVGVSQSVIGMIGPVAYAKRLSPVRGHAEWMRRYFGNAIGIYASAGQARRAENRITLDGDLPRVESRLDEEDIATLEGMHRKLMEIVAAIPGARVVEQFSSFDLGPGGAELRGGCADLVDETGRIRGTDYYVADASVFPTAGSGNPSLTIAALALRTAEAIVRR